MLGEREKRMLKGIIGGGGIEQNPSANAPHQSPVPSHQLRKGGFILAGHKLLQQAGIGNLAVDVVWSE
jgi:hypothetical protein